MSAKIIASACGLVFATMTGSANAQESSATAPSGAAEQAGTSAATSQSTSSTDVATRQAEQVGMQNVRSVEGATVLQGSSSTGTLWAAPSSSVAAPFVPWYVGVDEIPPEFREHRYLRHGSASTYVTPDYGLQEAWPAKTRRTRIIPRCSPPSRRSRTTPSPSSLG